METVAVSNGKLYTSSKLQMSKPWYHYTVLYTFILNCVLLFAVSYPFKLESFDIHVHVATVSIV